METVVVKAQFLQKKKQDEVAKMKSDIASHLWAAKTPLPALLILSTIKEVRECPENLKEWISSLVFASKECFHEIPELVTL
ncbi:IST1-like protein [Prunus yedoensis var. nudiflora]|uniref:IST1-like protein n=1 Tax=Prunus yedoensis var. nudiflora TaxID=2094558 RepID=A0A314ZGQ6_PRUYE|nr:IST1-like protein [Prunus yedoensis var. nudiflora]